VVVEKKRHGPADGEVEVNGCKAIGAYNALLFLESQWETAEHLISRNLTDKRRQYKVFVTTEEHEKLC
jgi:hypothetical protein